MFSNMMILRRIRQYTLAYKGVRSYSASLEDVVNYAFRKEIISKSPEQFYPTISSTRSSYPIVRVPQFISNYKDVDFASFDNKKHPDLIQIEGKVKAIRKAGKAMYFIDVVQDGSKVQVCASNKLLESMSKEDFAQAHAFIRKGDYISCVGNPSTTNVGELTLKVSQPLQVTSPCLNSVTIPDKLSDRQLINRNRVMNYLVDPLLKEKILVKSAITKAIRNFLCSDGFVEVQTPIISGAGTGANAEPFVTTLKALSDEKLQLRVAPELWLKKLVIGGFDKVFEIGMNFRNEGIDLTHNPEFLTCEFYRSFTSLAQLMKITENMFASIYDDLASKAPLLPILNDQLLLLTPLRSGDFPKYEFVPTLEERAGHKLPAELNSESLIAYYHAIGQPVPALTSPANLLDNLSGIYLELISNEIRNTPIFIYNQPSLMSPLAKSTGVQYGDSEYDVSLRFELFINGKEYVNSYEEENSPFAQKEKFQLQQANKEDFNDNDSVIPDWNYVLQMEYGLPPTGGWGCGIDRLTMIFSGSSRIEDVLTFGTVKDVIKQ